MRRTWIAIAWVAAGIGWTGTARATALEDAFANANRAFARGDYAAAVAGYEELARMGVDSATLWYNRGVAEARTGRWGWAIFCFEKALRIDPHDEDAAHNLRVLREYLARRATEQGRKAQLAPTVTPWRAVLDRFSARGAALGFLSFWALTFLLWWGRRLCRKETLRLTMAVSAAVSLLAACAMGVITAGKHYQYAYQHEAVVVAPGPDPTPVFDAPESPTRRFTLEEGNRVSVLSLRGDWTQVQDDRGRTGWLPQDQLGLL